jgi:diguanylate cyclase (GGDEF)-like protein
MDLMQTAMLICATSLFVTTGVLLIIRTMPSRDGIGWWVLAAALQFVIYALGVVFFGVEETVASMTTFFILQMTVMQAIGIGMLQYIDKNTNVLFRFLFLSLISIYILNTMVEGNKTYAICIFVTYLAVSAFHTSFVVWRAKQPILWLNMAALFLFAAGIHWLDYPIMSKVEWFAPIGFLLGLLLAMGLYFSLATVALLQFKKITNDSEQKAIRAAIHDPLTDLFNRSHLDTLYAKYKGYADTGKGSFVLLYIDLDGFKAVNDTYGHKAGDVILIVLAKRLKRWLADKGDAVRVGGDELVIINRLRSDATMNMVYGTSAAQSVLSILEKPIIDGKNIYNISGSIGGCFYDPDYCCLDDMLSRADKLMYHAKKTGGSRVVFDEIPQTISSVSSAELSRVPSFQATASATK